MKIGNISSGFHLPHRNGEGEGPTFWNLQFSNEVESKLVCDCDSPSVL